jgi:hypothetical protein
MSKPSKNSNEKIHFYAKKFPAEFEMHPSNKLYCKLCNCIVNSSRKSTLDKHRNSKKHQERLLERKNEKQTTQTFLKTAKKEFLDIFVDAFTSADIPLKKCNNKKMAELFTYMGFNIPYEATARNFLLKNYAEKKFEKLKSSFFEKQVFIIIDESEIRRNKYINVLAGDISMPKKNI